MPKIFIYFPRFYEFIHKLSPYIGNEPNFFLHFLHCGIQVVKMVPVHSRHSIHIYCMNELMKHCQSMTCLALTCFSHVCIISKSKSYVVWYKRLFFCQFSLLYMSSHGDERIIIAKFLVITNFQLLQTQVLLRFLLSLRCSATMRKMPIFYFQKTLSDPSSRGFSLISFHGLLVLFWHNITYFYTT